MTNEEKTIRSLELKVEKLTEKLKKSNAERIQLKKQVNSLKLKVSRIERMREAEFVAGQEWHKEKAQLKNRCITTNNRATQWQLRAEMLEKALDIDPDELWKIDDHKRVRQQNIEFMHRYQDAEAEIAVLKKLLKQRGITYVKAVHSYGV